ARRAKATPSTQGRADPPLASSSLTIRRPGSSTTAYPRLPSSAINVDLPPLEHPEMTTNRSILLAPTLHCSCMSPAQCFLSKRLGGVPRTVHVARWRLQRALVGQASFPEFLGNLDEWAGDQFSDRILPKTIGASAAPLTLTTPPIAPPYGPGHQRPHR